MQLKLSTQTSFVSYREAKTIPGLFRKRVTQSPAVVAYREFDEDAEQWLDYTWNDMAQLVARYQSALANLSFSKGDRVGILLRNSVNWVACDIAILASGCVTVPLYTHDSPTSTARIISHAQCRLIVLDSYERWTSLQPLIEKSSGPEHVWVKTPFPQTDETAITDVSATLLDTALSGAADLLEDVPCRPEDLATLIYTSGTTGDPKGVMLSHKAILWNAEAVTKITEILPSDVLLSLLPLAHAFERTLGYYLPMMSGSTIAYARSVGTLHDDFTFIRPTIFLGVPRLYERICNRLHKQADRNSVTRWLLDMTVEIGWRRHEADRDRAPPPSLPQRLIWPALNWLVAWRVLLAFGGRLRLAVSGGAPLDRNVARFLCGLGLPLVEGYGLTEAAPVVTATTLEDSLPGSVGRPLHGVEIKLGERDELLIRTPSTMLGYWRNDEATAEVLEKSGWMRTGDIAEIRDGRIFIRGRLKELIVLSTGENIVPSRIEAAITRDPLFDQACVLGDGRPCLVAVVVPNADEWQRLATRLGIDDNDLANPIAIREFLARMRECTQQLSKPSQVRGIHADLSPWTIDSGLLTPTLKVKLRLIERRYRNEISGLYKQLQSRRAGSAGQSTS